jgi:hypothetical protein
MAQLTAPVRSMGQRIRSHWRGIVVACGLVLVLGSLAVTMLNNQSSLAERRYAAAAAEADRLDPGWRLDDILAGREKLPDRENSALVVRDIAGELPGGWPGIKLYDRSFSFLGETPEVRLNKGRVEQLRDVFEAAADVVPQARRLSEIPRGQLDGMRPQVERLEQVAPNTYVDASFPYAKDLARVIFLLWVDARLRIEDGDIDAAILDLRAMVNAGRSVGDYPGLSAQMSRFGGIWKAIPCLETALAQGQAGTTSLEALQSLLENEAQQPARTIAMRGERAIIDDLFQQIHAGKLGVSAIPSFSDYPFWLKPFSNRINVRVNQANILHHHTRVAEAGRLPEAEQVGAMKALNDEWVAEAKQWGFLERERRLTERLMFGRVGGVPMWLGVKEALIRTAIAALAAERFRVEEGRWPGSLDQLVPRYIAAVPRDPFAKGPLKVRKFADGLFIYSVGYDGKDDGGAIDPELRMRGGADTGFRLWDVDRRRQAAGTDSDGKASGSDSTP